MIDLHLWKPQAKRTSLVRAPAAFVAAAFLLAATVSGPSLAIIVRGMAGPVTVDALVAGLSMLAMSAGAALTATAAIGIPVWLFLRVVRRESWPDYTLAGAFAGALSALVLNTALQPPPGSWKIGMCIWAVCAGSLTALTFWRMAHDQAADGTMNSKDEAHAE